MSKMDLSRKLFLMFVLFYCGSCLELNQIHKRKVTTQLICPGANPDCILKNSSRIVNIAHITATGHNDSLHYIITTVGLPTLFVAKTPVHSTLQLDIKQFLSSSDVYGSLKFSDAPTYIYAAAITKLLEYDDIDDVADVAKTTNNTEWHRHDLTDLSWDNASLTSDLAHNSLNLSVSESQDQLRFINNGSLSLQFMVSGDMERSDVLPHLQFTPRSAMFDLRLEGLETAFNNSRFALELSLLTMHTNQSQHNKTIHQSLDDEHSPGVFRSVDWTTQGVAQKSGAFVQWKPVCYVKHEYKTSTSSRVGHTDLLNVTHLNDLQMTLVEAYLGNLSEADGVRVHATNISFGFPKDEYYVKTNYTGWSFSVGVGVPPSDTLSAPIIIIISVGLGLPILMFLVGGIGLCIRKRKQADKLYVDINPGEYSRIE